MSKLQLCFQKHGTSFTLAVAPTAKMAELFAINHLADLVTCWQQEIGQFDHQRVSSRLAAISIEKCQLATKVKKKLQSLGIKTLGKLLSLPVASIRKRFGEETTTYLKQLTDSDYITSDCFSPPNIFNKRLEFIDVIHHSESLLFPMNRLLKDLLHFLRLNQQQAQLLNWQLEDIYQQKTNFTVLLSDAEIDLNIYLDLTKLRLESIKLTGPIEAINLRVDELNNLSVIENSLFSRSEKFNNDLFFVNKIRARLGNDSCQWLQESQQHIPELAGGLNQQRQSSKDNIQDIIRPTWLLPIPQAIGLKREQLNWNGTLTITSSEERITQGWWNKPVVRDYFIARHETGTLYWIFYDGIKQRWFLHGVFS
jgi:protein ImuB